MENVDFSDILKNQFNITDFSVPYTKTEVKNTHINIGTGKDLLIKELAEMVVAKIGGKSKVVYKNLPSDDPTQRKPVITLAKEKLGWTPTVALDDGLEKTIAFCTEDTL